MADFNPVPPISPFRYWCQMALPTVYDDSLSYYELLNKVVVQLNMVISATNATNGNVAALHAAFVELKNYVDSKLGDDDLQTYVDNWLVSHPEVTTTVQNGSLTLEKFTETTIPYIAKDYVTPEMHGAIGDGDIANAAIDTLAWGAAINDAILHNKIICAFGRYSINTPLTFGNISVHVFGELIFDLPAPEDDDDETTALTIENAFHQNYTIHAKLRQQDNYLTVGVHVKNTNSSEFSIFSTNFTTALRVSGEGSGPNEPGGAAYNIFRRVECRNAATMLDVAALNVGGWCNENYFYNLRLTNESQTLHVGKNYVIGILIRQNGTNNNPIDSNHFINLCVETLAHGIIIQNNTRNCSFENVRCEATESPVELGENTQYNYINITYGNVNYVDYSGKNHIANYSDNWRAPLTLDTVLCDYRFMRDVASNAYHRLTIPQAHFIDSTGAIVPYFYNLDDTATGAHTTDQTIIGALVDVSQDKIVKLSFKATAAVIRLAIIPFDENDVFISSGVIAQKYVESKSNNPAGSDALVPALIPIGVWSNHNDKYTLEQTNRINTDYYRYGTNESSDNTTLVFPDNVKKAYVGLYLTSDANITALKLSGTINNTVLYNSTIPALSTIPSATPHNALNQIVNSSEDTTRWIYNGTAWTTMT